MDYVYRKEIRWVGDGCCYPRHRDDDWWWLIGYECLHLIYLYMCCHWLVTYWLVLGWGWSGSGREGVRKRTVGYTDRSWEHNHFHMWFASWVIFLWVVRDRACWGIEEENGHLSLKEVVWMGLRNSILELYYIQVPLGILAISLYIISILESILFLFIFSFNIKFKF